MLNSKLATHYGLKKPNNSGFTRVKLKPESGRGGLLTHASILSLTSDGTRHRPVHRGAWLSEVILGHTPTPPPPNVDPLEPVKTNQPKTTIRSQLEAHRLMLTVHHAIQRLTHWDWLLKILMPLAVGG